MANQQLMDFINAEKAAGKTQDQIVAELKANGWTDEAIASELGSAPVAPAPTPAPQQPQPQQRPQPVYQPQSQYRPQAAAAQPGSLGIKGIIITIIVFLLVASGVVGAIYYFKKPKASTAPMPMGNTPGANPMTPPMTPPPAR